MKVGALCVVVVAAGGVATLPGLTTAECFLVRVLASMATRGDGIGTIRAIPIILTPTRITAIPTTPALTMATRITVIHITNTVILARSLAWRGYYRGLLTIFSGRRLAIRFDHPRRIKVFRLPTKWTRVNQSVAKLISMQVQAKVTNTKAQDQVGAAFALL